jgi:hypothetical protein
MHFAVRLRPIGAGNIADHNYEQENPKRHSSGFLHRISWLPGDQTETARS